jgi:hypothetical protein
MIFPESHLKSKLSDYVMRFIAEQGVKHCFWSSEAVRLRSRVLERCCYQNDSQDEVVQRKNSQNPPCIKRPEVILRLAGIQQDPVIRKPDSAKKRSTPTHPKLNASFTDFMSKLDGGMSGSK